ncbi:MAG: mannose-1-phosphate guanylyltransferase [Oscillospiraceae bacterium]|nr:mannose-1-phosphate guanylyltransferase [Oscillospiraceae bacterium]
MKKYGVIMAGGGGTRFWPLSRQKTPKQLLNLSGKDLMVNEAIDRLSYTAEKDDIFIVTNQTQAETMLAATAGRICPNHILAEPASRNTAACIGYAAMEILRKYGDGIMVITPSDAYIKDTPAFTRVLAEAVEAAQTQNKLVTVGITPSFPATGYGYIRYSNTPGIGAKAVLEFKEKPDAETAKAYVATGEYAWNSGMFIWKASTILEKFKALIPDIYADLERIGNAMNTPEERAVIQAAYPNIRKISVDYAIMEPSAAAGDVLVVPGEFGWNDVGSWDMMGVLHDADAQDNVTLGDTLALNTTGSVLYSSGKLIAAVDVKDLVVVETPDAILVCPKAKAQDVKCVVDALAAAGRTELL